MPVPTLITDLDTVANNNSPPGTESAKGSIDNYLRTHAAFIKQNYDSLATKAIAGPLGASGITGAATSGANSNITSLSGLTTPLSVAQGGTGGTVGPATAGANSNITSLSGLTTPLSIAQGGTAGNTAAAARTALGIGKTIGQIVTSATSAVATGTTVMPFDDTIPQSTEGDQYLSLAITPQNASSTLEIEVVIAGMSSSVVNDMVAALFQDAGANALAAEAASVALANASTNLSFTHIMTSATTSATTFKIRAGGSLAGTTTFNGSASARKLGGVLASRITITEILP